MIKKLKVDSAFTLIEVIISITILSFLMIYVYTIIDESSITKDRVIIEDRAVIQAERAIMRFEVDFAQIYSPLYYDPLPPKKRSDSSEDELSDIKKAKEYKATKNFPLVTKSGHPVPLVSLEDKNELIFMTTANRRKIQDSKQSRFAWIRYALKASETESESGSDKGGNDLVRSITPFNPFEGEVDWDKVKEYVIMKNVESLSFSFWNAKREKFVTSTKELDEDPNLIRMIKMEMVWIDTNGNEEEVSRIYRPNWPFFDTKEDEKTIKAETKLLQQKNKSKKRKAN
jgi:prepilin-type N-terminal cleavage/methylation domain-containing protein